jgi:diaminopimelate decarboxylase
MIPSEIIPSKKNGYTPAPPLTPKVSPWMKNLLMRKENIYEMIGDGSTPTHMLNLEEFKKNITRLCSIFSGYKVKHKVFFARKANKLPCFVSSAKELGIGIDVASFSELNETISLGVSGEKIIVTSIAKSKILIDLALTSQATLIIDCMDELHAVLSRAKEIRIPPKIGLRFSGFPGLSGTGRSRFGFSMKDTSSIVTVLKDNILMRPEISTLHAHIDKYEIQDRITACEQLLFLCDIFNSKDIPCKGIDLGGGIPITYLDSKNEWNKFTSSFKEDFLNGHNRFTYTGDFLGSSTDSRPNYQINMYPAYGEVTKDTFIDTILSTSFSNGKKLDKELSDRDLSLSFEPGRSLLDNCGLTAASVAFTKHDTHGALLIGLSMNHTQLIPFRAELPFDPIVISRRQDCSPPCDAFVVGNMCSESDFIFKRCLAFPFTPCRDDIFVFPNTAGYFMHHKEVGTHGGPLAKNMVVHPEHLRPLFLYD